MPWIAACLALALAFTYGGTSDAPKEDRIAEAFARAASLHRRAIVHRHPQSWEGYPIAMRGDSDSVVWMNATPKGMEMGGAH